MATIRAGNRAVLVVVDVQVGVMRGAWQVDRVVANIAHAVECARTQGVPIIWVQHSDAELVEGSADWQLVPELKPRPNEVVVHKQFNSSFEGTLEQELAKLGATQLVLAGAATTWCIRATAYAALERGYDLTVLSDAHTMVSEHAAVLINDLNNTMTWLRYPGRRSNTATADEFFGRK